MKESKAYELRQTRPNQYSSLLRLVCRRQVESSGPNLRHLSPQEINLCTKLSRMHVVATATCESSTCRDARRARRAAATSRRATNRPWADGRVRYGSGMPKFHQRLATQRHGHTRQRAYHTTTIPTLSAVRARLSWILVWLAGTGGVWKMCGREAGAGDAGRGQERNISACCTRRARVAHQQLPVEPARTAIVAVLAYKAHAAFGEEWVGLWGRVLVSSAAQEEPDKRADSHSAYNASNHPSRDSTGIALATA